MVSINISNVTDDTFQFLTKSYLNFYHYNNDCEKLEYSTKSTNVHGAIKI